MKRTPSILIIVLASIAACAAAAPAAALGASAGWTAHKATGVPLLSVAAADPARAWAVGPVSTIVATTDGGASWVAQTSPTTADLYGVAFSDASDGWAVGVAGDAGTVIATTDGGADWAAQTAPTTGALIGVSSRGQECWAVGAAGTIIATTDGGASWVAQSCPVQHDLYSVSFADADHGWAVGDLGTILTTTNGGSDWTVQKSPTTDYLNGVTCCDALHAWAVGERGVILDTSDGGAHWAVARATTPRSPDLYTIAVADKRRGWAVGVGGVILATTNGGLTWRTQGCPTSQDLASVAFADTLHGFVAGTAGSMLTTTRAGWSDVRPPTATAVATVQEPDFGFGSSPPVTTSTQSWHRSAVSVALRASDGAGGSGVASVQYSLDGGKAWTRGSSFTVSAPADHSNDGSHTFLYRATDNAGNVEAARSGRVAIDTRRPTPVAKWSAAALRGARTTLRYYVSDRRPGSPTATVTIRIYDTRSTLVKKAVLAGVTVNADHGYVFVCRLPQGGYRFFVSVTDAAGNRAASVATNRLAVRDRPIGFAGPLLR